MADIYLITILAPAVLLMNIVAYYAFIPQRYRVGYNISEAEDGIAYSFSSDILPYLLLVSSIYLLMKSQGTIAGMFSPDYDLAKYILHIEGARVSVFQVFTNPLLTYVSAFIYLFGFSFLLVFTFAVFLLTKQIRTFQEYAIAFALVYMVAFPFYIFTPVKVTGYTLSNVMPLLYNLSPMIPAGLNTVDPSFDNCFPSLHAALSVMAMLFILFRTDLKGFKVFAVLITLAVQFSIFYLGIHWITDSIAGVMLAIISYYVATRYRDWIEWGKVHVL